jgi:hypothetical protein
MELRMRAEVLMPIPMGHGVLLTQALNSIAIYHFVASIPFNITIPKLFRTTYYF